MRTTKHSYECSQRVDCPTCGQVAGHECLNVRTGKPTPDPHMDRMTYHLLLRTNTLSRYALREDHLVLDLRAGDVLLMVTTPYDAKKLMAVCDASGDDWPRGHIFYSDKVTFLSFTGESYAWPAGMENFRPQNTPAP